MDQWNSTKRIRIKMQSAVIVLCFMALTTISSCHQHGGGHGEEDIAKPDKAHIQEHLNEQATMDAEKMSDEELQFYHFKLHDTDNNTVLDGLEVYKAVLHQLEDGKPKKQEEDAHPKTREELYKQATKREVETCAQVDDFMKTVDTNVDGLVSYIEFKVYTGVGRKGDGGAKKQ